MRFPSLDKPEMINAKAQSGKETLLLFFAPFASLYLCVK
jgi:hypothetical protein